MLGLGRYAVAISTVAALLCACSGSQPPMAAPGEIPQSFTGASSSYQVLYRFSHHTDGAHPEAKLIDVDGTLYGTAYAGGNPGCSFKTTCGTVYSISTSGKEHTLYRFSGGTDGAHPEARLINVKGILYGTTAEGGGSGCIDQLGCGTVFSMSTSGTEKVLHRFADGSDGADPQAGLTELNGSLYGTTYRGGGSGCDYGMGCGTVYSVSTSGTEKVLHRFKGGSDGYYPLSGLLNVDHVLYGTTRFGGKQIDCGTVYSIGANGSKAALYRFKGGFNRGPDGCQPQAGLIDVNGTLYGTTAGGGMYGKGTVFSVSFGGVDKVLHSFDQFADGTYPASGLIYLQGRFYGATNLGGGCSYWRGCGALYSMTKHGSLRLLHTFTSGSDGRAAVSELNDVTGTLYGATSEGGTPGCSHGCGTVFTISP